ncbi:DNRLRE domain-containing protein, partial [Candidatus Poseidonia alphae]|nr:DNRLRE domain-containing protein [Candidatus Poseidonia alphae]
MSRIPSNTRSSTALLLVMMFLLADLLLPQTLEGWTELDDEISPQHVVSTHSPTADTYISMASPSSTYNTSASGVLSSGLMADSRLLLRFPMNYTSSDTVHSATIDLQCTTDVLGPTAMSVYAGEMKRSWNGSYASWSVYADNMMWSELGANGASDRGVWEPPVEVTGNGTVSLNVTSIAQTAARNNLGNLSVIVSSLGAEYECHLLETTSTSNRPQLILNTTSSTPNAPPTIETALPIPDGAPWMESDFLLKPVTTPSLSYDNNSGSDVEIQLSNNEDWRSETDQDWFFSTLTTTFGATGTSGYYTIPSSLSLTNGSTMHMRVRSVDSTGQIGNWDVTSFKLPSLDVSDNGDGSATMTFSPSSVGLVEDFIQDSTVSETAKSVAHGELVTLESSMTSSKERLIHIRTSLDQIGLHDNLTIVSAKMDLTRSSYTGDPVVSLHGMEDSGLWDEEEITWNKMSDTGITWYDGGRGNGTATVALADGNKSSSAFSFEATQAVQNYLDSGDEFPLDMMLAVR